MEALVLMAIMALAQTDDTSITPIEEGNSSLTLDFSLGSNSYDDVLGQDLDSGLFWSAGVGLEWGVGETSAFSVEAEYSQHNGDTNGSFDVLGGDLGKSYGHSVAWDGDLQSDVFMVNALFTQTLFSEDRNGFLVYAGLGIGYSHNTGNLNTSTTSRYSKSNKRAHFDASSDEFAWQALFGVGWRFSDHCKVYTGGRYFDGGSLVDNLDISAESMVWEVGFTYSF